MAGIMINNNDKEAQNEDYDDFMNAGKNDLIFDSNKNYSKIKKNISKELVSSKFKLGFLFFIFSLVGYVINLSICAQGTFGLTQFSYQVFHTLHAHLPQSVCAFTCGTALTSFPLIFTLLFLNNFERRYLLSKMNWLIILVPILVTAFIFIATWHDFPSTKPVHIFGALNLQEALIDGFIWAASAILAPYFLQLLFYMRSRQKLFQAG